MTAQRYVRRQVYGAGSPAASDPFWTSVYMLCHGDGSNGGTTFTDSKGLRTLTAVGAAVTSTTQSKFNQSSYIPGTSAGVSVDPNDTSIAISTGDFCVEGWWYLNTTGIIQCFFAAEQNGTQAVLRCDVSAANQLYCLTRAQSGGATILTGATGTTLVSGQWYHVAFTRVSGTCYVFLDGALIDSKANAHNLTDTYRTSFGYNRRLGAEFSNSYIDDIRVTIGAGRYSAPFAVPTAAYPDM